MKALFQRFALIILLFSAIGTSLAGTHRGYEPKMLETGKFLFQGNCAACHGMNAEGTVKNWHKKNESGKHPPPPLNGTAHTWHHSPEQLLYTINKGGVEMGGQMPAFESVLNKNEKLALIDYIYSLWPKEIQDKYDKRFK